MKLNLKSSFSLLPILILTFSLIETRSSKKIIRSTPDQSNNHWQNYGDNWSSWAETWSSGWSQDDKHATNLTSDADSKEELSSDLVVDNESVTLFGSKEMTRKQIKKNLTIYGAAILTDIHVGDVSTSYGRLKAHESVFNQLDAHGCTSLSKCIVHDNAKIYGLLDAHVCTFESALTVWATGIMLTDCKILGDVIVKRDKGTKKQRIELVDTTIEGSITFEKNKGLVILKGRSSIKGDIIGGTIIRS